MLKIIKLKLRRQFKVLVLIIKPHHMIVSCDPLTVMFVMLFPFPFFEWPKGNYAYKFLPK